MKIPIRKQKAIKLGFGLAIAVALALIVAIVGVAWIKGGVQGAQMVEIPVDPASLSTGGAA